MDTREVGRSDGTTEAYHFGFTENTGEELGPVLVEIANALWSLHSAALDTHSALADICSAIEESSDPQIADSLGKMTQSLDMIKYRLMGR